MRSFQFNNIALHCNNHISLTFEQCDYSRVRHREERQFIIGWQQLIGTMTKAHSHTDKYSVAMEWCVVSRTDSYTEKTPMSDGQSVRGRERVS